MGLEMEFRRDMWVLDTEIGEMGFGRGDGE